MQVGVALKGGALSSARTLAFQLYEQCIRMRRRVRATSYRNMTYLRVWIARVCIHHASAEMHFSAVCADVQFFSIQF